MPHPLKLTVALRTGPLVSASETFTKTVVLTLTYISLGVMLTEKFLSTFETLIVAVSHSPLSSVAFTVSQHLK